MTRPATAVRSRVAANSTSGSSGIRRGRRRGGKTESKTAAGRVRGRTTAWPAVATPHCRGTIPTVMPKDTWKFWDHKSVGDFLLRSSRRHLLYPHSIHTAGAPLFILPDRSSTSTSCTSKVRSRTTRTRCRAARCSRSATKPWRSCASRIRSRSRRSRPADHQAPASAHVRHLEASSDQDARAVPEARALGH